MDSRYLLTNIQYKKNESTLFQGRIYEHRFC